MSGTITARCLERSEEYVINLSWVHRESLGSREAGKHEARKVLYAVAARQQVIPYSDLSGQISSVRMEPHDIRFGYFLGEISREDDAEGKGLTSVLVVHKNDNRPGFGFFELAEDLGRDASDEEKCWSNELKAVHDYWGKKGMR